LFHFYFVLLCLDTFVFVLGLQVLHVVHCNEHLPILFERLFSSSKFGIKLSKFQQIESSLFLIIAFIDTKGNQTNRYQNKDHTKGNEKAFVGFFSVVEAIINSCKSFNRSDKLIAHRHEALRLASESHQRHIAQSNHIISS